MLLGLIIVCGLLSIVYAVYTVNSLMAADAGSARMQEIAAAVAEGAQAYLRRQYTTIAGVGIVVFIALGLLLSWTVAIGFAIGAILSGATSFVFDASDQMPAAMQTEFYKELLVYIQNPSQLDAVLTDLDSVQASSYNQ